MKRLTLATFTLLAVTSGAFASSDIRSVAERAERFEQQFSKGLNSSTIPVASRDVYRSLVDRLEDSVGAAAKSATSGETRKKLVDAMEAAVEIDRFMTRSRWTAEATANWQELRNELNTLAEQHELPLLSPSLRASD